LARGQIKDVSDAELKELVASLLAAQKETDRQMKETDRQMKETDRQMKETDRRMKETDRLIQETDRRLNQLAGLFGNQMGRLAEAIVEPSCLRLFQQRGIAVTHTMRRVESAVSGAEMEIDVLLANGRELVAVEIKVKLGVRDVNQFLDKLRLIRKAFPRYHGQVIYGAVAGLECPEHVRRYAARKGLLVLKTSGDLMEIDNPLSFRPKKF
jgi:hypothetical protein